MSMCQHCVFYTTRLVGAELVYVLKEPSILLVSDLPLRLLNDRGGGNNRHLCFFDAHNNTEGRIIPLLPRKNEFAQPLSFSLDQRSIRHRAQIREDISSRKRINPRQRRLSIIPTGFLPE